MKDIFTNPHSPVNQKNFEKLLRTETNLPEVYRGFLLCKNPLNLWVIAFPNDNGTLPQSYEVPSRLKGSFTTKPLAREAVEKYFEREEAVKDIAKSFKNKEVSLDDAKIALRTWATTEKEIMELLELTTKEGFKSNA